MNKTPLLLRSLIVLAVVAVFASALYPLAPKNYYDVFKTLLKDPGDPEAASLIEDAKARQAKDPNLFESQALLKAADERQVRLVDKVNGKNLHNNKDVISLIRKESASSIRLGLDLAGGVEFYLDLIPDENQSEEMQRNMKDDFNRYRDVAVETLRKRLEGLNIYEAEIAPAGETSIVLRAPLVAQDEKAKLRDIIQMSAKLEFRLVVNASPEELARYKANPRLTPPGTEYLEYTDIDRDGRPVVRGFLVQLRPEMDGRNITMARPQRDDMTGQLNITLQFNTDGAADFKRVTENNVGRLLAIVLDGKLYCAPNINEPIGGGSARISGSFTDEEAKSIADALVSGSFPFKIEVRAVFDTDPTLGRASVRNGIYVGAVSLLLVAVFMLIYYRFSGMISVVALALNILLILGALAAFDCTLTLPGIAGIVLTIGMAVDANVLVFERIREELRGGKSLINAVNAGYERALTAVVDSNITTLITAFILMYVGTGAIKGFAVTLCIGILSTLFSAIFVTRLVYDYLFRYFQPQKLTMMQLLSSPRVDFIKFWRYALMISGAMIVLLIVLFAVRGKGVLGIDFTGGSAITFNYTEQGSTSAMAKTLREAGYDEPSVTYKSNIAAREGEADILEVRLRGAKKSAEETKMAVGRLLREKYPQCGIRLETANIQQLDGLIGREFTKAATLAILLALVGIGAYIVFRYELSFAIAGVLALLHDVLVVLAIYLLTGRTIGLTAVAAFLTVIGYSINDTVVIFDRIRENLSLHKGESFGDIANLSINQTLSRTMITSLTTFIVVFIMWLFGGAEISDFVFVMMWGVLIGTFSSVCLSAPFVAWRMQGRKSKLGAK